MNLSPQAASPERTAGAPARFSRERALGDLALISGPLAIAALLVWVSLRIAAGGDLRFGAAWAPELSLDLAFRLDGLSLIFSLLIALVGAVVFLYSRRYLKPGAPVLRFYLYLGFFKLSMLGVVLADNLLLLFVFWELTSVASYLLIGFEHTRERARAAALQALLVTGLGGLALLAGVVLIGSAAGTYSISALLAQGAQTGKETSTAALLLLFAGAFTKSAQFPFHRWLPAAMEAPAPVSAYLHSATMVKAGIYLLARMHPAFGGEALWTPLLMAAGAVTAIVGAWITLRLTDLKLMLAYSTVAVLGILTLLAGIGTPLAIQTLVTLLVAHALYKAALFLIAGAIEHETGTRDVRQLGGLGRTMPWTGVAALLAGVSMAGLPPLFGFAAKEMVYQCGLESGPNWWFVTGDLFAAGVMLFAAAAAVAWRPFAGPATPAAARAHEAPVELWIGPLALGTMGLLFGLFPEVIGPLVGAAAGAVNPAAGRFKLSLFHGLNLPLLLGAVTAVLGAALYQAVRYTQAAGAVWPWPVRPRRLPAGDAAALPTPASEGLPRPARCYEFALRSLRATAAWQTAVLQSGQLRRYFAVIFASLTLLISAGLLRHRGPVLPESLGEMRVAEAGVLLLTVLSLGLAVFSSSRLASVAGLGGVGAGVALLFALFGAPDLAMTQFAVEALTVLLLALMLHRLPDSVQLTPKRERRLDMLLAGAAGTVVTLLVLVAMATVKEGGLARFYLENSRDVAGGRNAVNVIVTDFRALDTLGEITVLVAAAFGFFALRKLRSAKGTRQ